jgi:hypothetical protein
MSRFPPAFAAVLGFISLLALAAGAHAQPPGAPVAADPDMRLDPLQPDFTLSALPTTLRVAAGRSGFRVTHRFTRPVNEGSFGDLLANAFGLDGSAQVGLEFRYGLRPGTQFGVHRTSDRSIQLFTQQSVLTQRDGGPLGLDLLVTLEGANNLREHHRSALGLLVSRHAPGAVLYVQPIVVLNSNPTDVGAQHALLLGLGSRIRVGEQVYLVAEFSPRLAGHTPGGHQVSAAIERRTGGHMFQLSVSNGFGTTLGQIARGTPGYDNWYLGFNISRKFYR